MRRLETGGNVRLPAWVDEYMEMPEGPENFARVVASLAPGLAVFDRYERRARSRRKFTIRAFDLARERSA